MLKLHSIHYVWKLTYIAAQQMHHLQLSALQRLEVEQSVLKRLQPPTVVQLPGQQSCENNCVSKKMLRGEHSSEYLCCRAMLKVENHVPFQAAYRVSKLLVSSGYEVLMESARVAICCTTSWLAGSSSRSLGRLHEVVAGQ